MTTLSQPPAKALAAEAVNRVVITDVDGHAVQALDADGKPVKVVELTTAGYHLDTGTPIDNCLSYADQHQLARVIAGLMHVGAHEYGENFVLLVMRHGDPNDDMGSGAPVLGGYHLDQ